MHKGHRARVRERIRANGIESLSEHQVLEYILFHTVPYKDTNELAHMLINKFGSFSAVLEANPADLMTVKGISEVSADLLSSLPKLFKIYQENKYNRVEINNSEDMKAYVKSKFVSEQNEKFYVIALDCSMRIVNCTMLNEGGVDYVRFDTKNIVEIAIRNNAKYIVIAHNHPDEIKKPSREDIDATFRITSVLNTIGIKLIDHIICAGDECISFASRKELKNFLS